VDLDQAGGSGAQRRDRDRHVVDPGLAAAAGSDATTKDVLAVGCGHRAGGLDEDGAALLDREHRGDGRGIAPRADELGLAASAADHLERVQQQALAGAGLAADDGQSLSRRQPRALDDHQILDGEFGEHG
jgi:hypothetical protein